MSSVKLTCPQCQAPLRFLKAPTLGKAIRCPGCQLKFMPPENVLAAIDADAPGTSSSAAWVALGAVVLVVVAAAILALWRPWAPETQDPSPALVEASPTDAHAPPGPEQTGQPMQTAEKSMPLSADETPVEATAPSSVEVAPPMPVVGAPKPLAPKEQEAPSAAPPPKKSTPKTYAELKRPDDLAAPPALAAINTTPTHPLQANINEAIAKAVANLKRTQMNTGSWQAGDRQVGYAALAGLALLEGGVPPGDPAVRKAAEHVRNTSVLHYRTYQLSLVILFLDRLGDPQDVPVIQALAMQIIAGQTERGGWGYDCPPLTAQQTQVLYKALKAREPKLPAALPKEADRGPEKSAPDGPAPPPAAKPSPDRPKFPTKKPSAAPRAVLQMPAGPTHPLLDIPGLRALLSHEDNSNTQFALMALWAARRHGVPAYGTLMLGAYRLAATQNSDGGWGYSSIPMPDDSSPAMTCVGLLGLAMGHGLAQPFKKDKNAVAAADPRIEAGLRRLGAEINPQRLRNLYFAWSVERVAMLYKLPTIGNKDWYDVGARELLRAQLPDGAWKLGNYAGSEPPLDTSFAILFLKRTNLVQDLSDRLPLFMAISDPDAGPRR
jgi:hypothetical protein